MRRVLVFRSNRIEGMYLFVDASERLERVPHALLSRFGPPAEVMTLDLHPGRKLARADAVDVLTAIVERGFHLQLPPREDEAIRAG